ncbi:hypothetical protein B0T26DRAFT_757486 [Lasiosphaeria miniovina]|uniref:Uncharacterized protein n=1 Tax=Lasiosphaeria miniovina TaxID=1954250 RepID=A0AA39ZUW0_9PEZI|nr:uncharacterized protein B0T26DRAFT_757486 [Lasiosphaeria miniovina]KAK0703989.1 hypothetical protein B0T26DRAFT_757486 [Lasiosphaeria miniovina]
MEHPPQRSPVENGNPLYDPAYDTNLFDLLVVMLVISDANLCSACRDKLLVELRETSVCAMGDLDEKHVDPATAPSRIINLVISHVSADHDEGEYKHSVKIVTTAFPTPVSIRKARLIKEVHDPTWYPALVERFVDQFARTTQPDGLTPLQAKLWYVLASRFTRSDVQNDRPPLEYAYNWLQLLNLMQDTDRCCWPVAKEPYHTGNKHEVTFDVFCRAISNIDQGGDLDCALLDGLKTYRHVLRDEVSDPDDWLEMLPLLWQVPPVVYARRRVAENLNRTDPSMFAELTAPWRRHLASGSRPWGSLILPEPGDMPLSPPNSFTEWSARRDAQQLFDSLFARMFLDNLSGPEQPNEPWIRVYAGEEREPDEELDDEGV